MAQTIVQYIYYSRLKEFVRKLVARASNLYNFTKLCAGTVERLMKIQELKWRRRSSSSFRTRKSTATISPS